MGVGMPPCPQALPFSMRLHLLLWGSTFMSWALGAVPVSRYCGRLEFWDQDLGCCRRCLERFGPPSCQDSEFSRHCGITDRGDHLVLPFTLCPPGLCNKEWAEQCSPCQEHPQPPAARASHYQALCAKVSPGWCGEPWVGGLGSPHNPFLLPKVPIPPRKPCPANRSTPEPSSSAPGPSPRNGFQGSSTPAGSLVTHPPDWSPVWHVVGITALLLVGGLLISAILQMFLGRAESRGKVAGAGEACEFSRREESVPATLAHQPLSRLLDELEVLEELVILLDPEPGPRGGSAWGTTRHLAARYGLPASWATFAYSLRPARSPLRALLETVTARDPTAQLGQLAEHLGQLGRGDALGVLYKLR
ncbi:IGF-like family receptor 1 isoform X1 [Monodelphis domestica]|uniref:IGF-like family receptor 1 isoform X1 n=2 Tax=Monodelphis domestica TaxID=13616 RepID=UPI0024E21B8D|nr:IGF-like family receptor 1 isoform X1 [Monodelphis domestica]